MGFTESSYFLVPNVYTMLNSRSFTRGGDNLPCTSSINRLAEVVKDYVQSAQRRQYKDPVCSAELPDPIVDLDIFVLPDQVRVRFFLLTSKSLLTTQ